MALQVWLPLTKDLRNQGLSDVTVSGGTIDNNGKLGKCYLVSKTSRIIISQSISATSEWTINFWAKLPSSMNNATAWEAMFSFPTINADTGANGASYINWASYHNVKIWDDANHQWLWAAPGAHFNYDTWYMWTVAHTVNGNGVTGKIYIDGNLIGTYNNTTHQMKIRPGNIIIGDGISTGGFYINDFRIYDHCLSPMEVKELSKGLVLHYPLNRGGFGPSNLLKNGFGELDKKNWGNSNVYTDVPSGHSEIKKSYRDNESVEFIPLFRNCTYKFTGWVKAASTSGYSYPSLKPYDADKLFISTYHCREGFNLSTMTTLKQQLKAGDTKIYVNDLSAWNANSGHYYDVAAIFSYTDGQGYTWPDGIYTRNCPAFASSTEAKTNLDKTNNIITLLTAYTGPTMPAGTKVCASTYGSTYFYPWGGISNSSIADWTYKEGTFSSENVRMECAKYLRVYTYSTCYQAGMTLSNLTVDNLTTNIEYDTSGYCNNGTRTGAFTWTSDTPKYQVSTYFEDYTRKLRAPLVFTPTTITMAVWIKSSATGRGSYHMPLNINGAAYEFSIGSDGKFRNGFYINNSRVVDTVNSKNVLDGQWHHLCATYDGTTIKRYVDGISVTGGDHVAAGTLASTSMLYVGDYGTNETYGNNQIYESDIRIYATALSADDVKSLYQNNAYIDSSGNVYGQIRS